MHLTIHRKPIKSLRIRVLPDQSVIVSAPKRLSSEYIASFIEAKKVWIEKALAKFKGHQRLRVAEKEILLYGTGYTFIHDSSLKTKTIVDHDTKTIRSWVDLHGKIKLKNWYKSYAKEYLSSFLENLAKTYGLHYNKLYIRDQKTKWGTCSSQKNIWLNRKLIKMPKHIIEYVICHELAHLKEMNHSKRFRAVVESFYPDYKAAVARMKKYGLSLQ